MSTTLVELRSETSDPWRLAWRDEEGLVQLRGMHPIHKDQLVWVRRHGTAGSGEPHRVLDAQVYRVSTEEWTVLTLRQPGGNTDR